MTHTGVRQKLFSDLDSDLVVKAPLLLNLAIRREYQSTMTRTIILLSAFVLAIFSTGCGKGADAARLELAQMNIPFTERAFIDTVRQGDTSALALFLDAGMSTATKTYDGQPALSVAALSNQADALKLLLIRGADLNGRDKHGGTALMTACWKGNLETVNMLLAEKADRNAQAANGMTALMFAAWEGHAEVVEALLEKGADPGISDKDGWTALMRATFKGRTNTAKVLLERGADAGVESNDQKTALTIAEDRRLPEMVQLLKSVGATK
ncbi:MAG TPA: ankyrin repeat domain-containing protein [Blastocatellia bacterium]|nr:ankyrin repeat domain-containing protein [Blastocatellia bacterium]